MTSFQFLFFLISLSILSLLVLVLLRIIDLVKAHTSQKIIFLKLSLTIIATSPFVFYLLKLFSLRKLFIISSNQSINEKSQGIFQIMVSDNQISWSFYVMLLYGMGLFFMLFRIILSYMNARNQLLSSCEVCIQGQSVFLNKNIQTPISFGLPKAKIYFPSDAFSKWQRREIQISLAHEKIHIERNDYLWKLLSMIVQALLFFSPWIYYLHKRLELEMEIFCDAKTCQETSADIQEYGNILLAMVCSQAKNFIFNNLTDSTLKRRFIAMKNKTRNATFLVVILSIILFLMSPAVIAIASGVTENGKFKITSKMIIDGKLISSPVIIAKSNQKAFIILTNTHNAGSQGLKVELIAKNASVFGLNNGIAINYDIQYKNGQEKLHSKPRVVVEPNKEIKIQLSSDSTHSYEMNVLAERVNS